MTGMTTEAIPMELLERYLQAVRFLLPRKQRDDVARELSEDLRAQIEERQDELGRPLAEDELAALLRKSGHPATLALRYQPERYLIGPRVFPLFWYGVKVVAGVLAIVHLLLPAVYFVVTNQPEKIVGQFLRFPGVALPALAVLTLCFAVLDTDVVRTAVERALADWKPQDLPPIARQERQPVSSMAGVIMPLVFGIWWLIGLKFPYLILGPGADYVQFGPPFHRLFVPMAVGTVATAVVGWFRLARPRDTRLILATSLFVDSLSLVVLYLLWRGGGPWMVAGESLARLRGPEDLIGLVNLALQLGLTVGLIVSAITFAWRYLGDPSRRGWRIGSDSATSQS